MGDWSGLLHDLLVEVARRTHSVEDFMAFRGVCTSWRAAASRDKFAKWPRVSLLMLSEEKESNDREFYSLSRGSQIALPSQTTFPHCQCTEQASTYFQDFFIQRAVLSANPSDAPDFVLMLAYYNGSFLAFWRAGDKSWTVNESRIGAVCNINFYNGKFYAIDHGGDVWVWDGLGITVAQPKLVMNVFVYRDFIFRHFHLVESGGQLLIVAQNNTLVDGEDCVEAYWHSELGGGKNIGVYHLEDGSIY